MYEIKNINIGDRMEFKQLEAFVKTIELRSFSKAADAIYISQPSVSLYINALEQELETRLLLRNSKEISTTRAGDVFYKYAKNLLALKDKAIFATQMKTDTFQGEVEIFASSVPAQYLLPEAMVSFNKQYPNISFKIIQSDTEKVITSVISRTCEAGIVGGKLASCKCDYIHITRESLILIAPPDYKCKNISKKNIAQFFYNEKVVMREEGSATRNHWIHYLREQCVNPDKLHPVASFSSTQSIIQAVSKGLGVSVVSSIAAKDYLEKGLISQIKLEAPLPERDFYFIFKNDAIVPPHVKLFAEFLCNFNADSSK